ncbi:MAG: hypothetical protein OXP68_09690 [Anaerolineaceae bacterium]|nr:hypothetical protein [Anaerolineaceae bacterium]MDE0329610.1 hypothetical protein [Anaerolineaceae bacterium]
MQTFQRPLTLVVLLATALAACAPADLDVTPTATSTPVPTATPTPDSTPTSMPTAAPTEVVETPLVDVFLENVPEPVAAGGIQWRRDPERDVSKVRNVQNGIAKRLYLIERQGGKASFTFGVFDSQEDALVYYDFVKDLRTVLENGEANEDFPMPNLFGTGLYGSNAIFSIDSYFIEVGIEQFSGTAGNPLPSLSRQAIRIVEETLTSRAAAAEAGETVILTLSLLLDSLPEQVMAGDVAWERGARSLLNVADGQAVSMPWRAGDLRVTLYMALFDAQNAALAYNPVEADDGKIPGSVTLSIGEQYVALVCDSPAGGLEVARILAETLNALASV